MCKDRANIVANCRRCKANTRLHCIYRKKTKAKTYVSSKKKAGA